MVEDALYIIAKPFLAASLRGVLIAVGKLAVTLKLESSHPNHPNLCQLMRPRVMSLVLDHESC